MVLLGVLQFALQRVGTLQPRHRANVPAWNHHVQHLHVQHIVLLPRLAISNADLQSKI